MSFLTWVRDLFAKLADSGQQSPPMMIDRSVTPRPQEAPTAQPGAVARPRDAAADARMAQQRIHRGFAAALPVEDRFGLSGRTMEIDRLVRAMLSERKHVVVYGARGSGKTSLIRVFGELADEVGQVVLYESISGAIGFADIFRPFLSALPGADRDTPVGRAVAALRDRPFTARDLAGALVEVRTATVLVIDEFDRIEDRATKEEVAALMKLLSDMHARLTICVVGIATSVTDLVEGHPSLRRHMAGVAVGPIARDELVTLVENCTRKSGLTIERDAALRLANGAYGSPYHARLFGLNAALAANQRGSDRIEAGDVDAGFTAALTDWAEVSGPAYGLFDHLLRDPAARSPLLQIAESAALSMGDGGTGSAAPQAVVDALSGALVPATPGRYVFQDSLAPQFLAVMAAHGARANRFVGQ